MVIRISVYKKLFALPPSRNMLIKVRVTLAYLADLQYVRLE
jgi:hypothetical protein